MGKSIVYTMDRYLPYVFILLVLAASCVSADSVRVKLDCWNGWDSMCGEGYMCSSGSAWTPACSFTDPVPSEYKVTKIKTTAHGSGCNRNGGVIFNVNLNANSAGDGVLVGCAAGTCSSATAVSPDYELGFPGYIYGGTNVISIDPTEKDLCLANVDLIIYYEKVTTTTSSTTTTTIERAPVPEELPAAPEFGSKAIVLAVLLASPAMSYLIARVK